MQTYRIQYLFNNYLDNNISSSEREELMSMITEAGNDEQIRSLIEKLIDETGEEIDISEATASTILNAILQKDKVSVVAHRVHFLKTTWFRYAAAVILIATGATIYLVNQDPSQSSSSAQNNEKAKEIDIAPGSNKAILTIGSKTIDLASDKTGIAVSDIITYNDGEKIADAGQIMLLTTPRGGQYQATLPDGSKVWLNAQSSIKCASKFVGDKREVEVTGEAYIEVTKDVKRPFFVTTRKSTIQVLGTSFNINAYIEEDAEKTTLIDGSVRVFSKQGKYGNGGVVILKPREQAVLAYNSQLTTRIVDSEAVIAWKSGFFNFEGVSLKDAMKQLSRWYDLEIIYEKGVPDIRFFGEISRNVKLSDILAGLERAEVHFRVEEGRRLVVMP